MNISSEILERGKDFVLGILETDLSEEYVFHSINHTLDVYKNSQIIGKAIGLSRNDLNTLGMSAIFHDVGYSRQSKDHELISAGIAKEFLSKHNIDENIISQVERAILATKVPQQPADVISKALCDADLMHLTYDDYFERIKAMCLEWKLTGRPDLNELDFHQQSIEFFSKHQYHTQYGKSVLSIKKESNLKRISDRIAKLKE